MDGCDGIQSLNLGQQLLFYYLVIIKHVIVITKIIPFLTATSQDWNKVFFFVLISVSTSKRSLKLYWKYRRSGLKWVLLEVIDLCTGIWFQWCFCMLEFFNLFLKLQLRLMYILYLATEDWWGLVHFFQWSACRHSNPQRCLIWLGPHPCSLFWRYISSTAVILGITHT